MMGLPDPPPPGTTMLPPGTYADRVVLITGGGTGLGRAMAVEFARLGATVVIASRDPDHLAAGLTAIGDVGGRGTAVECDVRDSRLIGEAFERAESVAGPVDVLINNAAGNFPSPAGRLTDRGWRAVIDIVLTGTFLCSREFATRCIARGGGGAILNIGATTAWTGGPGTAHSAAAKAGVDNLTKTLAVEWAPFGIRVNCLAPGPFPHDDLPETLQRASPPGLQGRRTPAGRVGQPHELAWAATWMCSPFASYLTGHTLVLDGGNWLRRGIAMPEFVAVHEQLGLPPLPEG